MRESSASRRSDTPTPSKGSKKKKLSTEEKREKEELKRIDKELKQKQKQLKKEEKKRRQSYTSSSRRSSSTPNEVQVTHYDEKETSHNAANTSGTAVFNVPDAAALLQSEKDKSNSQINDEDFRWEFAQFVKNIMQSEYLTKNNNTNRVTMVLLRNSFECDYIILMTNTLQVKRYLLKLLLIFSNKKVPVYTTTLSPREATASDYCFNVEVCLTEGSTDLSLHLTVRPEMKNSFYKHYSKYYNNKFTKFSIDPLFPVDTTNIQVDCLNDARKRRLLYYVIKEMIYEDYYIFDNSVGSLNMNNSSIIYAADDESCNNTSQGSPNGSMTHLAVHNTNVIQLLNEINEQLTKVQEEEERQRQQADNEVELALLKNAKIVSHDNKNNDQDIEKLVMFPSHVDDMRDFIWESAITHLRHLIFTVVKNYYAVKIKIDAIRDKNRNVADKAQMNRKN
ncbi:hypothetical protein AGDE_15629 [Angomonas deanei]|uniref:Uncharacterized protein n=1 Tax=Angomonas deanei TaxID=59799 RepID=A0A7G2CJJ9_9TRYP|nr:hypothetical protein AGDE_15629 [Angomonas deanei]CAD2219569.1 hypothetical protein, conserved [Angomonas deanei]|eukprot:EPY18732.1 hypothetical protein AGDE_15629 [Angomonas deanei]